MNTGIKELVQRGDDTSNCYVCGQANPHGLQVKFEREGEHGSRALYTARVEHDGWPGLLHGGITFALMDEAVSWAAFFQGLRAVTARLETNFKRPIPTGTPLLVRGWTVSRKRRLITARAELRVVDTSDLMADLEATMFLLAEPETDSTA